MDHIRTHAIALHGFLGSKEDFSFLSTKIPTFFVDLAPAIFKENQFESFDQMKARVLKDIETEIRRLRGSTEEIVIFSYSMGSKFVFSIIKSILNLNSEANLKFVFISTHFGIYETEIEKKTELKFRDDMNTTFLTLLESLSKKQFLEKWSMLPLFSNDQRLESNWSLEQISHYFKFINKSQLLNDLVEILKQLNALVVYGSDDLKYKTQALSLKTKLGPLCQVKFMEIAGRSHRLLENSDLNQILGSQFFSSK